MTKPFTEMGGPRGQRLRGADPDLGLDTMSLSCQGDMEMVMSITEFITCFGVQESPGFRSRRVDTVFCHA